MNPHRYGAPAAPQATTSPSSAAVVIVSAPPWLEPCSPTRAGVDLRPGQHGIDGADSVDVEAAVGVGVRVDDVVDEKARVAGIETCVRAQLAARRHGERGVTLPGPLLRDDRLGDVSRQQHQHRIRRSGASRARGTGVPAGDPQPVPALVVNVEDRASAVDRSGEYSNDGRSGTDLICSRVAAQNSSKSSGTCTSTVWRRGSRPFVMPDHHPEPTLWAPLLRCS